MSTAVSPRRLLLVEDSSTMRRMISTLLGDEGYVVETAVDGVDGLAKARAKVPELILTDYEMPEMDGLEATRRIRAMNGMPAQVPIVAMTANAGNDIVERCLDAGMTDYISKPFRSQTIGEHLARLFPAA